MGTSNEGGKQVRFGPITGRAGETAHPYATPYNSSFLHWPRTDGPNIAPLGQAPGRQCAQGLLGEGRNPKNQILASKGRKSILNLLSKNLI